MRRFVLVAGRSAKFWEVSTAGASLHVRFGALGADGQTKTKDLGAAKNALAELEALVRKKLAEGYREEGDTEASPKRPRVAWDARTRALVHPRRRSNIRVANVDVSKAWKTITSAFDAETRAKVKTGRRHASAEDCAFMDDAVRGFASKTPPQTSTPIVEAVRAHLLAVHNHHVNTPPALRKAHDALVHFWCEAYGVPFAVETMTETFRTALCDLGSLYIVRRPENFGRTGNGSDVTPWHVLRARLAVADEETYAKARAVAEPVHDQGADVLFRCALSFVFADEEAWARETLAKSSYFIQGDRGSPTMYSCALPLVSCFRDEKTIRKFIVAGGISLTFVHDIIDALGPDAFGLLRDHYERGTWRKAAAQREFFAAVTLIESNEAAAWVGRHLHDKVVGALAEAYFARCPDLR